MGAAIEAIDDFTHRAASCAGVRLRDATYLLAASIEASVTFPVRRRDINFGFPVAPRLKARSERDLSFWTVSISFRSEVRIDIGHICPIPLTEARTFLSRES
ncbi:hypothetical protein NBRC3280_3340 [Acetobacter pasteurianus NBRC 3280]|uniref:Uncharacterized protein n=2 Tax=Acetobacter pasteurianus TaxID=438 RepID=A0A401X8X9_ACEPA|nr:hypothetical protein NBRC3277_3345 [Acetobacter pasteurianus NBRC 3277]GCD64352.1 hypothetical protein NBRC3278_3445 [Acetobacter pasteurianus NBRC 3278]GCD70705.1 hypothetical protein NBRC3280_3340 [Acetobacter pasteurianus NBRC 3280]